jgi:hypothetical protein
VLAAHIYAGGNSIDAATQDKVYELVKAQGGHTVITKVRLAALLYANAKRLLCPGSHCQQWSVHPHPSPRISLTPLQVSPQ